MATINDEILPISLFVNSFPDAKPAVQYTARGRDNYPSIKKAA